MATIRQPDRLVLASTSPRRAELMREAGYQFRVVPPPFAEPEEKHPHVDPANYAESLAYFKARSIADTNPADTILAADTIAVMDDEIFGKPEDREDARRILCRLSGSSHRVITGVVLMHPETDARQMGHSISVIRVRKLSTEDIESYLDTGAWEGKAGAYGIQDHGDAFVERYEGSFSNIVGLPMELVRDMFGTWA
ncbi:septum formation protein Maf [cyanobacterium TDX16]|nr:septum formation protein Maf [cyanobacterium TDX16]